MADHEYMTSQEIADVLRVTERTARRIIRERIPHLCIGGRQYRVERADFEDFCQSKIKGDKINVERNQR